MKRIFYLIAVMVGIAALSSCNSEDTTWDKFKENREANLDYYYRMRDSLDANGQLYYKTLVPAWNPAAEVLIHYFNDRSETAENLSPLYTSTCDMIYYGRLYTGEPFDSSYAMTAYGPAIQRLSPQKVVVGMAVAMMDMRVGDTCEVVMPYMQGYGASENGKIKPYSTLRFNLRMKNIPYYEIKP